MNFNKYSFWGIQDLCCKSSIVINMRQSWIDLQWMKSLIPFILLLFVTSVMASCKNDDSTVVPETSKIKISCHFASKAEGQKRLAANTEYYNRLNQNDIEWRMKKTGATIDELKAFAQTCVRDFTDEEKTVIGDAMAFIEGKLQAMGAALPFPEDDIVFIKTTAEEESGASGYTLMTDIYLGEKLLRLGFTKPDRFREIIAHELFHYLTRNSPEFRRQMYSLIGFTVTGTDYVFAPAIQNMILNNPDVDHIDNYAEFTINGVKRNCALILLFTKTWAEASAESGDSASFFNCNQTVLVPVDELDTYYPTAEATDFWNVVGKNTDYVFAPEECLADNFAFAVLYGLDGKTYKTPQLITDILQRIKGE